MIALIKSVTGGFDQESGIFWIFSHFVFMSSDSPKKGGIISHILEIAIIEKGQLGTVC